MKTMLAAVTIAAIACCGLSGPAHATADPCPADSEDCRVHGLCKADGSDNCRPTARGCKDSWGCKAFGACVLTRLGKDNHNLITEDGCHSRGDTHCRRSTACKHLGRCSMTSFGAGGMQCVAAPTSGDCRKATICVQDGRCMANDDEVCVATDTTCAASEGCDALGACATDEQGDGCFPGGAEDCAKAAICRQGKACHFDEDTWACMVTPTAKRGICPAGREVIKIKRAEASSTHPRWKSYTFGADHLIDGALETSWQPKTAKAGGVGQTVTLVLDKPMPVAGVEIANGFQRRDDWLGDLFVWNNRLRHAWVEAGAARELAVFERDKRGFTTVLLPVTTTDRVTVKVGSIHPGLLWNDLAVSEIRVIGCKPATK